MSWALFTRGRIVPDALPAHHSALVDWRNVVSLLEASCDTPAGGKATTSAPSTSFSGTDTGMSGDCGRHSCLGPCRSRAPGLRHARGGAGEWSGRQRRRVIARAPGPALGYHRRDAQRSRPPPRASDHRTGCRCPAGHRARSPHAAGLARYWKGIGDVTVGMDRQGFDLQLTKYGNRGWRASFYVSGIEHAPSPSRPSRASLGGQTSP